MINKSPGTKLAALSRRSFFGHAAVAGGAVLLGSSIPNRALAEDEGLPGVCDFPVPIPHINTPPGAHFYFPGPVDGSAVTTDPSGAHPEGRDPSGPDAKLKLKVELVKRKTLGGTALL